MRNFENESCNARFQNLRQDAAASAPGSFRKGIAMFENIFIGVMVVVAVVGAVLGWWFENGGPKEKESGQDAAAGRQKDGETVRGQNEMHSSNEAAGDTAAKGRK